MYKLAIALLCSGFAVIAHAERYDVYVHDQSWVQPNDAPLRVKPIDLSNLGSSFTEGQNMRKAWDARKARKKHDQAMQELGVLDLNDNNAVMSFAKKYPDSIDNLKDMLQLQKQLNN
ncbi:hypothetical protein ACTXLJ_12335 [Psychrobacter celer]|uniref:hypothetical protein n=1 Tax=Psychrobacter celer TaxID=306572 RepID=UPI003FD5C49D